MKIGINHVYFPSVKCLSIKIFLFNLTSSYGKDWSSKIWFLKKLEIKFTLILLESSGCFILKCLFYFKLHLFWKKKIHRDKKKYTKNKTATTKKQTTQKKYAYSLKHNFSDPSRYFISVKHAVLWEIQGFHFESEHK